MNVRELAIKAIEDVLRRLDEMEPFAGESAIRANLSVTKSALYGNTGALAELKRIYE